MDITIKIQKEMVSIYASRGPLICQFMTYQTVWCNYIGKFKLAKDLTIEDIINYIMDKEEMIGETDKQLDITAYGGSYGGGKPYTPSLVFKKEEVNV